MINIVLSITLVAVFKAAFLRLFGSQREPESRSVAQEADRLPGDLRSALHKSQVTAQ
jgi:hypothetical protein